MKELGTLKKGRCFKYEGLDRCDLQIVTEGCVKIINSLEFYLKRILKSWELSIF